MGLRKIKIKCPDRLRDVNCTNESNQSTSQVELKQWCAKYNIFNECDLNDNNIKSFPLDFNNNFKSYENINQILRIGSVRL